MGEHGRKGAPTKGRSGSKIALLAVVSMPHKLSWRETVEGGAVSAKGVHPKYGLA